MNSKTPPLEDPELWALALAREPHCPAPERIAAAAAGELPAAEREVVLAHAGTCPACGAELELVSRFRSAEESDSAAVDRVVARLRGETPASVIPFPSARRRGSAAVWRWAAAALVVIAAGFAFQAARTGLGPQVEGPSGSTVVRGARVEAVEPSGESSGAPQRMIWRAVAGAASYRVEILDAAGDGLWSGVAEAPPMDLPGTVRSELRSHTRYAWRVIALDAAGRELARSPAVEFSVGPGPGPDPAPPAPRR